MCCDSCHGPLTNGNFSKLSTNHIGFAVIPIISTNSSPVIVVADFYSAFIFSEAISQTNSSIRADNVHLFLKCFENIEIHQSGLQYWHNITTLPKHTIPATVESLQGLVVELIVEQSVSDVSLPSQLMFWITIGLSPEPNLDPLMAWPAKCTKHVN